MLVEIIAGMAFGLSVSNFIRIMKNRDRIQKLEVSVKREVIEIYEGLRETNKIITEIIQKIRR